MQNIIERIILAIFFLFGIAFSQTVPLDRSGPVVTLHSDSYQIGKQWYCPLCRKPVENGDRSKMDPKRCLSEWHDVMIDSSYFHDKIRYISDEELVRSLRIKELDQELHQALQVKDYDGISRILYRYFSSRKDNQRLSLYDPANKKYFTTIAEFLAEVRSDTSRYNRIVRSANAFFTPEKGYTLYDMNWGAHIDFNHSYRQTSKWGVHYLSFLDDQINQYLLQRDPVTAQAFENLFNQWYDQLDNIQIEHATNHAKIYDIVWYELGLANRTQRLIDAHRVFIDKITPETNKRLLKNILGSSRWLDQCLIKTPFHPYNWQTHTSFTLSYAALIYPEFSESATWLDRGKNNMVLHLRSDIMDDGGYVERTPSYAEYMYSVFYRYMLMLQYFKNDPSLMNQYLGRIEKYIEFFVLTNSPLAVNPPFNDAHRNKSLVRVFKEMGEFFHRGDFIGAIQHELSPETIASLKVKPIEPKTKSIDFPDSRFCVMRDSWDPNSLFMIINYGEFRNHCHYDQLDFEIYANGMPLAIDAGIGQLGYIDSLHVTWYKNPLSHNMLTVNEAIPEKMDKPGYDKIWSAQQRTEYFAATHDGYMRYQQARHRRHFIFSKNRYWLIVDQLFTNIKNKLIDFNLHTPCTMTELKDGFISTQENGFVIKHDCSDSSSIDKIKSSGEADLGGLANEPANRCIDWLILRKRSTGQEASDRMAALIMPFAKKDKSAADVRVEKIQLADAAAMGYKVIAGDREDLILLADGTYRTFTPQIAGDFKMGFISYRNGQVVYAGFSQVGKFALQGKMSRTFPKRQDFEVLQ
jgi:hypothetical protein